MAIYLISGDDILLEQKVRETVADCIGEYSSTTILTRFDEVDYMQQGSEPDITPLTIAAATAPMYEPLRVIEARHLGNFSKAEDMEPLLNYLQAPLTTTSLVLVWERGTGGRLPPLNKKLKDAVLAAGGKYISASKPRGYRGISDWFREQIKESGLSLDSAAQNEIQNHLGEDYGRLTSFLKTLASAFGSSASNSTQLGVVDILPFLGSKGSVPLWDLTSALAKGDGAGSLNILKRKFVSGSEPITILYFLINHYNRIAMLDGAGFRSGDEAAKALGISAYPAKLALAEAQNLGTRKLKKITALLSKADADLKGGSGLNPEIVLEILIARLAQQYRLKLVVN